MLFFVLYEPLLVPLWLPSFLGALFSSFSSLFSLFFLPVKDVFVCFVGFVFFLSRNWLNVGFLKREAVLETKTELEADSEAVVEA